MKRAGIYSAILATVVGLFGAALPRAEAASFVVTNLNDSFAGSLRQAIADANTNADETNTIYFEEVSGTITLTSGELQITKSLSIFGPGAGTLTVSGNNASRVFHAIATNMDVVISDLTISGGNTYNGSTYEPGGGIYVDYANGTMTLRNMVIENNTAGLGGGIYSSYATMTLINSTVRNNHLQSPPSSDGSFGAGIFARTATIQGSTISGNSKTGAGTGGGIYVMNGNGLTVTNSTISGNSMDQMGGIRSYNTDVSLMNVTITGNTATNLSLGSGGISIGSYDGSNLLSITNTIFSGNMSGGTPVNCAFSNLTPSSGGGNIDDGTTCGLNAASDMQSTDPQLGSLADNGGLTMTYAPLLVPLSPAIDGGVNTGAPPTDQRGWPRPWNPTVDSGAVEFMLPSLLTVDKGSSTGHGRILSSPPGIDEGINTASDSAYFPYNRRVTLAAIASGLSIFTGWSGTGCGDSVLMSTGKNCTATFTYCGSDPVLLLGDATYASIAEGFNHVDTLHQNLRVTASNRIGDLNLYTNTYANQIHGGYDCGFANQIGYTYVSGVVTIGGFSGSVTLDRIIIM